MKGQVEKLLPVPALETEGWVGYQHFKDPTRLPFNMLTYPSINCLIPSKDKLVPRKGKTLLGQSFTKEEVDIGFDSFSSDSSAVGQISEFDPGEETSAVNSFNSSAKIDDTHYINFWKSATSKGFAQVFEVIDGVVTALGTPLEFYASGVQNNSCYALGFKVINFWTGSSNDGFTQFFNVNPVTYQVTAIGSPLSFESGINTGNSCMIVDSTHFINFWGGGAGGITNKAQVFVADGSYNLTAVGSPLTVDAAAALTPYNCVRQVTSTKYINFWASGSNVGKVQVFSLDGSFAVTAVGSALTFDAVAGKFNSAFSTAGSASINYINFWTSGSNVGKVQSFNVNSGTFAVTALGSPLTFDAVAAFYNSCTYLGSSTHHFINFWQGTAGKLYAQAFEVNTTTNAVEALDVPFNFDTRTNTIYNSCVWIGDDGDGVNSIINFWGGTKVDTTSNINAAVFNVDIVLDDLTVEHACVGDDRILFVSVLTYNITGGGDKVTGVTYNGDAMTLAAKVALDSSRERYLYYLVNPDAGFNDVVVSTSGVDRSLDVAVASYFGALQSAPTIMSSVGPNAAVTSISISETTTVEDSWIVALFSGGAGYEDGLTEGTDTTFRGGTDNFQMADRGPISPPASTALSADFDSSTTAVAIAVAFAPAGGTPDAKNWPIIGHKKRFTNNGGYTMEVRIIKTDDVSLKDKVEILLKNPLTDLYQWYQITEQNNPLDAGTGERYYMDTFFDNNPLDPSRSRNNSRLVWVNGLKQIISWSGGIAPITEIVPNVSIKTTSNLSWVSLGFINPNLGGSPKIVVNGTAYDVTGGWDTDTLLLASTGDIAVGDIATAHISAEIGSLDVIILPEEYPFFDFCRQNKNYMFYGSFQSRKLFMSNNFDRPAFQEIIFVNASLDDLIIPSSSDFIGLGVYEFTITINTAGTPDTFNYSYSFPGGGGNGTNIAITGNAQVIGITGLEIQFLDTTGHAPGDTWRIMAQQAVGDIGNPDNPAAWGNFFYNLPRLTAQGYIFNLPANFWTMDPQEGDMYVSDQYGQWGFISTILNADVATETISYTPLKQISSAKAIYPYMIGHMENYIVFVTENKQLQFIGRKELLELPQTDYLSQPVQFDFEAATFHLGSIEYLGKMLDITSPKDSVMLVYDNRDGNKYWQPPQIYSENGILSIVENTLISHSNLRDQTFNLFTGEKGDNGAEYTVRARTALSSLPTKGSSGRWVSKFTSNSFLEGYITGNPQLVMTLFIAPNDQVGYSHDVNPVITDNHTDIASIGEAVLGAHPLGNDPVFEGSYFNEIYNMFKPILTYYFIAAQIACIAKTHSYSILSMGVNSAEAPTGNNTLIGDREVL